MRMQLRRENKFNTDIAPSTTSISMSLSTYLGLSVNDTKSTGIHPNHSVAFWIADEKSLATQELILLWYVCALHLFTDSDHTSLSYDIRPKKKKKKKKKKNTYVAMYAVLLKLQISLEYD